jgi:hypothetical protein
MRQTVNKAAIFEHCGYEPHVGQQAIHDAGPDEYGGARYRIAACGARFGKSHAAAFELVCAALAPNDHETVFWAVAPTHALANIVWRQTAAIFAQHFPQNVVKSSETDGLLIVRNMLGVESRVVRRTSERGVVGLVGATVHGMVCDESSAIDGEVWESALATRLLSTKGWVLAISTPRGVGGWWDRLLKIGLRGEDPSVWACRMPTSTNPRVDPKEIERARLSTPDTSFRENYLAESVARSGRVFDADLVTAACVGDFETPRPHTEYLAGCDLATGASGDKTVLTIARRGENGRMIVCYVETITGDWASQGRRLAALSRKWNDPSILLDVTGAGQPVSETWRDAHPELVLRSFVFTATSKQKLIRQGNLLIERGVTLPKRELCSLHDEALDYMWIDEKGERASAPVGQHDDHVSSWLLCAKWFGAAGDVVGRAVVNGIERMIDPESQRLRVEVQQPTVPEVVDVPGEDPVDADLRRRAEAFAARKAREAADVVRRITGTPKGARGTDGETGGGWTQSPRRSQWGFDLDLNLGGQ